MASFLLNKCAFASAIRVGRLRILVTIFLDEWLSLGFDQAQNPAYFISSA